MSGAEDRYRRVLTATPDLVFFVSADGRFLDVCTGNREDLFAPPEEIIGRRTDEVLPRKLALLANRVCRRVLATGKMERFEYVLEIKGEPRHFDARVSRLDDEQVLIVARNISTLKRTEEELRDAEAHVRRILASITECYYALDHAWRFVDANQNALRYFGASADELIGQTLWERYPTTIGSIVEERFREAVRTGRPVHFETRSTIQRHIWVEVHAYPESSGLAVYFRNITARKETEQRLRQQFELVNTIATTTAEGLVVMDAEGRLTFMNPASERILGWSFEEIAGRTLHEIVHYKHPDGSPYATDDCPLVNALVLGSPVRDREDMWIRKDGSFISIFCTCIPIVDAGQVTGAVLSLHDITDRKRAERLLERQNLLLEMIARGEGLARVLGEIARMVEQVSAGTMCTVMLVGPEGRLELGAAPSLPEEYAACIAGRLPNETTGPCAAAASRREPVFVGDVSRLSIWEEFRCDALAHGLRSCWSTPIFASDGTVLGTLALYSSEPRERAPSDAALIGIATYLAGIAIERLRADRERLELIEREREARRQAEESNRLKDEFLATLSHELRTPLNAILGWAKLLRGGTLSDEMAARAAEVIDRNAAAQGQLIEDILDVSRIITGRLKLDIQRIDPLPVVQGVVDSVRPAADAKSIELHARYGALGEVSVDVARFQQVIWNLISNAIKFTPNGGRITVELTTEAGDLVVRVSDTGQGIARAFLPYVFDRFRQADSSTTRQHGGLGLGLAIVRYVTEAHGGTVSAESEGQGQGATFTVRFPMKASEMPQGVEGPTAAEGFEHAAVERVSGALEGVRVLAVDDEPDTRELISVVLGDAGAEIRACASAAEAYAAFERGRPDVLLADISMPGEDGYALIERIRRLEGPGLHTPAVALTAYARPEDRERALAAGFDDHASKPLEPSRLVELIGRQIRRRE